MVNTERVVPIMKMDLLTMFGTILSLAGTDYSVLAASDVEGSFSVTGSGAAGNFLANQPVQTLDFPTGVTGATVYFVAAFDYAGMTIAGVAATPTGTVQPDGVTLYKAVLSSGAITITAVSPTVSA